MKIVGKKNRDKGLDQPYFNHKKNNLSLHGIIFERGTLELVFLLDHAKKGNANLMNYLLIWFDFRVLKQLESVLRMKCNTAKLNKKKTSTKKNNLI